MASIANTTQITYGANPTFLRTYSDGTQTIVNANGDVMPGEKISTIQQAVGLFNANIMPDAAQGATGSTTVDPFPKNTAFSPGTLTPEQAKMVGVDATTGAPAAASLLSDQVSTTSKQSGDNPGPTPAVGIIAPQAGRAQPPAAGVAPGQSSFKGIAVVFLVILGLWIVTGWSFARRLM